AILYGLILEVLNVHNSETYSYGKEFLLQIYNIPLAIGVGWAIIYYVSEKSVENYNLKWWQVPFFMALIALSIDLAIDAVAIRLGFWQWLIPLDQEWFGVPYDNFFGWLAVVWTFVFFVNLSKQNFLGKKISKIIKYLSVIISPFILAFQIISFTILSAIISGRFSLGEVIILFNNHDYSYAYYPEVQTVKAYFLWIIVAALVLYFIKEINKNRGKIIVKTDSLSLAIIVLLHSFFLISVFVKGFYLQYPIFIVISILSLLFHVIVLQTPFYVSKSRKKDIIL
ncbi:MAG: carotenoid biosynthesis protein, partial [Candidatus Pacebacteria bacterium]|nr:carotenoid biosynthesis protein [Candidatus Paceibacterota bacterium]